MDTPDIATLDPEHCYPALLARDPRFDGLWFVGVSSTGIYCRPICRVRTPRRENCSFYASAAQAEAAGYRPCLKCRPELAPQAGHAPWSVMDASRTLARQAADRLERCDDPEASMEQVAAALGISGRHLRRIFVAEHGVSPLQYLQTRRLLLAKQLLTDSSLPVTAVAHAAGFASLRRFNAAFVEQYRLQPSALRKSSAVRPLGAPTLRLAYRPPYAVPALLQFLAQRAIPGIESVDIAALRIERSLRIEHRGQTLQGRVAVQFDPRAAQLLVWPDAALWPASASLLPLLRRWLDLDAEPGRIDATLGALAADAPGLRLPGCVDRFELAVRAVLGQQVTVAAARTLASRLVQRFGTPLGADAVADGGSVTLLFPTPPTLAAAPVERIAELGIVRQRAEALRAIARAWPELSFARGGGTVDQARAELLSLPGVGPWTAAYMLMRGWSWPDAFPPGDIVLRRVLAGDAATPLSNAAVDVAAQPYRPYRSYAVLHLWRAASLKKKEEDRS